jgi:hypothetical protein
MGNGDYCPIKKLFGAVLITLACFTGCHAFAPFAVSRFALALNYFVFNMLIRFAYTAWFFTRFFSSIQFHVIRITRKIAIGCMVLFSLCRRINGLTETLEGNTHQQENCDDYDLFHLV